MRILPGSMFKQSGRKPICLASGIPVAAFPVTGPVDEITSNKVGKLDENLKKAIFEALELGANDCRNYALNYSWANCTEQFLNNLAPRF